MTLPVQSQAEDHAFTAVQRSDLHELFSQLSRPNVQWLLKMIVGDDGVADASVRGGDWIHAAVDVLIERKKMQHAVNQLRSTPKEGRRFLNRLEYVMTGKALEDYKNQQHLMDPEEPFIYDTAFDQVKAATCAIGLLNDDGVFSIQGTGFLIAPSLVLTNAHVIEHYLVVDDDAYAKHPNGRIKTKEDGDKVFCLFDYRYPPKPKLPPEKDCHAMVVRAVKDHWCWFARPPFPGDGQGGALAPTTQFDYAVIELERSVGNLPARYSGGAPRGWVSIPNAVFDPRRVAVIQHPQANALAWDIGDFSGWDDSKTRMRYAVSAAHGSSGGATVLMDGTVCALHNAEVKLGVVKSSTGQSIKANQGIVIEAIRADLRENSPDVLSAGETEKTLEADPTGFWNLSEVLADPRPVLGRRAFRQKIQAMMKKDGPRIMTVTSKVNERLPTDSRERQTGVRYSARLLRRIVGLHTRIAEYNISATTNNSFRPVEFVTAIATDLGLQGLSVPINEDKTQTESRGLIRACHSWLAARVLETAKASPDRFPAWIVINTLHPAGGRLQWASGQSDCIAALAGTELENYQPIEIRDLRWLFLGAEPDGLLVASKLRESEELTNEGLAQEYIDCVGLAWKALDLPPQNATQLNALYAQTVIDEFKEIRMPRQALAHWIRRMVQNHLKGAVR